MNKKRTLKQFIKDYLYITFGVAIAAVSFSFFLQPYSLVIGGVTGLGVILEKYMNASLVMFIANLILVLLGLIFMGKDFFLKTVYGSLIFPVFTYIFDLIYQALMKINEGNLLISSDGNMLLITIFSSILMGAGIGIAVKHGGNTGGTEIVQNIVYKYFKMPYSLSLFLFDGTIVFLGFLFVRNSNGDLRYDFLLYAIVFIYLCGIVIDQIVFRGFNKRAVSIISEKNEEIKQRILTDFDRGVTVLKGKGGYTGEDRSTLVCVLSSSEFYRLKQIINEIDPKAFYYVVRANEVGGEGFTYDE